MRPSTVAPVLLGLVGCASTPPPNIVVSNVANEAGGLVVATKFCAQYNRTAVFHTKLGESFQFDCVRRGH